MEQREEEWFEVSGEVCRIRREGVGGMSVVEVDARMAAWISCVSPTVAGLYLGPDLSLPEPHEGTPGIGGEWNIRATASVLSECYAQRMLDPNRELVEEIAMSKMPPPTRALDEEEDGDGPRRTFGGMSAVQRWERAVSGVSEKVAGLLHYGPSARFTAGEALLCGEEISSVQEEIRLKQVVDLLWRYPDGELEVVIVEGRSDHGNPPGPPSEDWRVILATEIVRTEFGRIPTVHIVRVQAGVAQAVKPSANHLANTIHRLFRKASEAVEKEQSSGAQILHDGFTYPLTYEAIAPLQRGEWPGGRTHPPRR